jgi:hypothetical protein
MRAIDARGWQLNRFLAYSVVRGPSWSENRNEFEIPPGIPDFPKAVTDKIEAYQNVRYFAQTVRETVSIIYGAMGTCILPVVYALLGACAYVLRLLEEQIKLRTYTKSNAHVARFLIAGIAGGVVGMFNNFYVGQSASVSPLAIAFLVGYSADVFFSFLQGLLETFTRRTDPQAQSGSKS